MNTRRQLIVAGVIAVVVTALFFLFLLKPKLNDISKTRSDVATARAEQDTLNTQLAHLQDVKKNAPATMAKLAALSQYVPATPDLPGFIQQVQDAATASSIDLQSIAPSPPAAVTSSNGVETISVTLTCQAGYFRIEDFLARLENLQRAVEVRAISLSPIQSPVSSELVLSSTISLTMFVATPNASTGGGAVPAPSSSASPSPSTTGSP
ncbi:MAG TPA: type 4a pilus biogenesis protein PilO [Actinomycetota bacterium]|nr:type 4a pilus biogenesis protein PilO [Actinomycetota bacterium]